MLLQRDAVALERGLRQARSAALVPLAVAMVLQVAAFAAPLWTMEIVRVPEGQFATCDAAELADPEPVAFRRFYTLLDGAGSPVSFGLDERPALLSELIPPLPAEFILSADLHVRGLAFAVGLLGIACLLVTAVNMFMALKSPWLGSALLATNLFATAVVTVTFLSSVKTKRSLATEQISIVCDGTVTGTLAFQRTIKHFGVNVAGLSIVPLLFCIVLHRRMRLISKVLGSIREIV